MKSASEKGTDTGIQVINTNWNNQINKIAKTNDCAKIMKFLQKTNGRRKTVKRKKTWLKFGIRKNEIYERKQQ